MKIQIPVHTETRKHLMINEVLDCLENGKPVSQVISKYQEFIRIGEVPDPEHK